MNFKNAFDLGEKEGGPRSVQHGVSEHLPDQGSALPIAFPLVVKRDVRKRMRPRRLSRRTLPLDRDRAAP